MIVRAAADGPVADAAAGSVLLVPTVPVTEALAGAARLTVLIGVAAAAGFVRRPDFSAAADQLDALAVACHPSSEFFVNPALTLAEHLSDGTPLLIGTDPVADALAGYACRSLAALAGYAGAALLSYQAAGSPPVLASAARTDGPAGTFYDPFLDGGDRDLRRRADREQRAGGRAVRAGHDPRRAGRPSACRRAPASCRRSRCRRSGPSRSTRRAHRPRRSRRWPPPCTPRCRGP